jgi:hypothetical protein
MAAFDANESLTPFREGMAMGDSVRPHTAPASEAAGSTLNALGQPRACRRFGRAGGAAWFVDGPFGGAVLRHYLRGGLAARISRDRHLWRGNERVSQLRRVPPAARLLRTQAPVPPPIAAYYVRKGLATAPPSCSIASTTCTRSATARTLGDTRLGSGPAAHRALPSRGPRPCRPQRHNLLFDDAATAG